MLGKLKNILVAVALFIGLFWVLSFLAGVTMGLIQLLIGPALIVGFIYLFIKIYTGFLKGKKKDETVSAKPSTAWATEDTDDAIARRLHKISKMESRLAAMDAGLHTK